MKRLYLMLFIIPLIIFSCKKKEDSYILTGKIYDQQDNNNCISDVSINVSAQLIENGTWNSSYSNLTSVKSESDGSFRIELKNMKLASIRIQLLKDMYFNEVIDIDPEALDKDEENYNDYYMYQLAWIKYHIVNQYPYDNQDIIKYRVSGLVRDCSECCDGEYVTITGTSVDQEEVCELPGGQNVNIEYLVTKHSNVTVYSIPLTIISGDTTEVYIAY